MVYLPGGTALGPFSTREEWLAARRLGLGGSDIGAILGMSTFTSELEVYYSKVEDLPEREVSEEAEIGRDIEGFILSQWARRYNPDGYIDDSLVAIQSDTFPFLLHSPDALLCEVVIGATAGIEVKN